MVSGNVTSSLTRLPKRLKWKLKSFLRNRKSRSEYFRRFWVTMIHLKIHCSIISRFSSGYRVPRPCLQISSRKLALSALRVWTMFKLLISSKRQVVKLCGKDFLKFDAGPFYYQVKCYLNTEKNWQGGYKDNSNLEMQRKILYMCLLFIVYFSDFRPRGFYIQITIARLWCQVLSQGRFNSYQSLMATILWSVSKSSPSLKAF